MPRITVDIDLEDVIDDISDKDLIEELQSRIKTDQIHKHLLSAGLKLVGNQSETASDLRLLADQIACGETADALSTLAAIFPNTPVYDAIGFARRTRCEAAA